MKIIYKCENCGMKMEENEVNSKLVDMESYYGVGGDFPDHHYQHMSFCPYCDSDELIETFDYEEEEDEEDDL